MGGGEALSGEVARPPLEGVSHAEPSTSACPSFVPQDLNDLNDCDGVAPQVFRLLWERTTCGGVSCQGVHLNDTVVFDENGKIEAWYFYSTKAGLKKKNSDKSDTRGGSKSRILRKHHKHLDGKRVFREWSRGVGRGKDGRSPTDCAAVLVYPGDRTKGARPGVHLAPEDKTSVEFLDWFQLERFLEGDDFPRFGVLQRWGPREPQNSVISAVWSPSLCLVERRTNCHRQDDTSVPLHRRMATFEGSSGYRLSQSTPLQGTKVAELVRRACGEIVAHVATVTGGSKRIVRLVAHFKVCAQTQRVTLLWCSCVRIRHKVVCEGVRGESDHLLPMFASLKVNLDPNVHVVALSTRSRRLGKFVWRMGDFECPACLEPKAEGERCHVAYKHVIAWHASSGCEGVVPEALRRAEGPALTEERFARVSQNPAFLFKTCGLCVECSLRVAEVAMEELSSQNPASTAVGMTAGMGGPAELKQYNILRLLGRDRERERERESARSGTRTERPRSATRTKRGESMVLRARSNSARRADRAKAPAVAAKPPPATPLALPTPPQDDLAFLAEDWESGDCVHSGSPILSSSVDYVGAEDEVTLERISRVNNLTTEEYEYLRAVLD